MLEYVVNQPVRSCCGLPRGECVCHEEAELQQSLRWLREDTNNNADVLPLPEPAVHSRAILDVDRDGPLVSPTLNYADDDEDINEEEYRRIGLPPNKSEWTAAHRLRWQAFLNANVNREIERIQLRKRFGPNAVVNEYDDQDILPLPNMEF